MHVDYDRESQNTTVQNANSIKVFNFEAKIFNYFFVCFFLPCYVFCFLFSNFSTMTSDLFEFLEKHW